MVYDTETVVSVPVVSLFSSSTESVEHYASTVLHFSQQEKKNTLVTSELESSEDFGKTKTKKEGRWPCLNHLRENLFLCLTIVGDIHVMVAVASSYAAYYNG